MTILGNHSLSGSKLYNDAKERGDMYAFADNWLVGCPGILELEKINRNDMPKNITGIANGTFARAQMLAEVDLPLSIQYVGTQAFYECPRLWKLVVEEGNDLIREMIESGVIRYGEKFRKAMDEGKKIDVTISASDLCDILKAQFSGGYTITNAATGTEIKWEPSGYVNKDAIQYVIKEANG